jgi:hypothetical protein
MKPTTGTSSIASGRSRRRGPTPVAQRQDQRQVVQHLQAELGQHHPRRDPAAGDVAQDVGEDPTEAHDHQHHEGGEGGLGEFAEQIGVELRHPAALL